MSSNGAGIRRSPHYFDINWHPLRADLEGRVLLPVLGEQYGVILEGAKSRSASTPPQGSFSAWYFDHRFPISPRSYPVDPGARRRKAWPDWPATSRRSATCRRPPARERAAELKQRLGRAALAIRRVAGAIETALQRFAGRRRRSGELCARLHRLLEAQSYRIADWRVAAEEINYRRFFNINDLAGLRMELPELFEKTHRLIFGLIESGVVQGLRIDHIDGLFDPAGLLRAAAAALRARRSTCSSKRSWRATRCCRIGRSPAPPAMTLSTRCWRSLSILPASGDDPALSPVHRSRRNFRRRSLRLQKADYAGQSRQRDECARARVSSAGDAANGAPAISRLNGMLAAIEEVIAAFPSLSHLCLAARRQRRRPPLYRLGDRAGAKALARCRDQHLRFSPRRPERATPRPASSTRARAAPCTPRCIFSRSPGRSWPRLPRTPPSTAMCGCWR